MCSVVSVGVNVGVGVVVAVGVVVVVVVRTSPRTESKLVKLLVSRFRCRWIPNSHRSSTVPCCKRGMASGDGRWFQKLKSRMFGAEIS